MSLKRKFKVHAMILVVYLVRGNVCLIEIYNYPDVLSNVILGVFLPTELILQQF